MTEADARNWLLDNVPRETLSALEQLVALILDEMPRQNLIAASTADHIWARHIVDSAQLLPLSPPAAKRWIDLGSGAGFPGMIIAIIAPDLRVTLVESRRKRIDFLSFVTETLGLGQRVTIVGQRIETLPPDPHDIISARAFAPLDRLLPLSLRFARPQSCWLLPKGRGAASELEAVGDSWQGDFRIVPSLTDPDAAIIVARNVQPRARGRATR